MTVRPRGSKVINSDSKSSDRYPSSLLLRLALSIGVGFVTMVVTAVPLGFVGWFVADLVVDSAAGFASAGSAVLRMVVFGSFAAGAGVGSYVYSAINLGRSGEEEPRPSEAVAAGAGLLLLGAMGLASGVAAVLLVVVPFVLFGGLIGSRRHDLKSPSTPQPGPYEMLEAA